LWGDSWQQQQTHYAAADTSTPAALQALLRWFYTCRLDVPFDAVPACLELCQQVQLTELVDEANLALNSEGSFAGSTSLICLSSFLARISVPDRFQHQHVQLLICCQSSLYA